MFANATILQKSIDNGLINTTNTVNWSGGNGGAGSSAAIIPDIEEGAVYTTPLQYAGYLASVPPPAPLPPPPAPLNSTLRLGANVVKIVPTNPQITWVSNIVDLSGIPTYAIGTDGTNIYPAGSFSGSAVFRSANGTTIKTLSGESSFGNPTAYVAKYTVGGTVQWTAKVIATGGAGSSTYITSVATDGVNLYAAGTYLGEVLQFYNSNGVLYHSYSSQPPFIGYYSGYIVKYDPSGNVLWVSFIYNNSSNLALNSMVYGPTGLYLTGQFGPTAKVTLYNPGVVDSGINVASVSGTFGNTAIVFKYNSSGLAKWATIIGNLNDIGSNGTGMAVDSNDNVYAVGTYINDVGVYSANIQGFPTRTLAGNQNATCSYIVKYNSSGNYVWAGHFVPTSAVSQINAYNVVTDSTGIYVTGTFNSPVNFSNNLHGNIGPLPYSKSGNYDIFICKYDIVGTALWATNIVGDTAGNTSTTGIITADGFVFVGGTFASAGLTPKNTPLAFTAAPFSLTNTNASNSFVVAYDQNGVAQWAFNPPLPGGANSYQGGPLIYADALYVTVNAE